MKSSPTSFQKISGKTQMGFSLLELMVVVGIIGILAALAVPQFAKFQARSRQAEAKASLSGIYFAQKSFMAEWNQFYGSLLVIGFAPDARNLRYNVGFDVLGIAAPAGYPAPDVASFSLNIGNACSYAMINGPCSFDVRYTTAAISGGVAPTALTFTARAEGNPNNLAMGNVDIWSVDQDKRIQHVVNGVQ